MNKLLKEIIAFLLAISIATPNVVVATTIDVTFDGNGGLYNETESQLKVSVKEDGTIGEENWPNNPIKSGYNFVGYDVDADFNTIFTEETTLTANWQAKKTTISLNADGGENGDASVQATYGNVLPSLVVPTKDGYNFLGYFNNDVQYYDADGNSSITWDKENETFELIAHYEVIEEVKEEQNPILLGSVQTCTVTVDLNGGTLNSGIPEGWSLTGTVYTKDYEYDTYYSSILEEWSDAVIIKDGYILQGVYDWNRTPWLWYLTEDMTVTVSYSEAVSVSASLSEHGTVDVKVDEIPKNTWIAFKDNCIVDYFNDFIVYVEVTPEAGYTVDSWIINGETQTGSDYQAKSNMVIVPHVAKACGLKVFGKVVTEDNKNDILGDGSCSYNSDTKTLTIKNPDGNENVKYFYSGIIAENDLTIVTKCDVSIYTGSYVSDFHGNTGNYAVIANGKLTIKADKKLTISSVDTGLYADDIVIDKGDLKIDSYKYGINANNSFTVNSTDSPNISSFSNNQTSILYKSANLNDATVSGANDYYDGTTHFLLQLAQSPVIITFGTLPTQYDIWVNTVRVTDENKDTENNFKYDPSSNTLTITSSIYGNGGYGVYALGDLNVKIGAANDSYVSIYCFNTSTAGESYGIYCTGDLTIDSDYENVTFSVDSGNAVLRSVGIFCDGVLTIKTPVNANSGTVNNKVNGFAISAGTWARSGINVIGNDPDTTYLYSYARGVNNNGYANYGILVGDGNPGYDTEVTLNVTNGSIDGHVPHYTSSCASSYGVYSYGSINLNAGTIESFIDCNTNDDSSIIYCGSDMSVTNGSKVICENVGFYNREGIVVKGLEVKNNLTIDDSNVKVEASTSSDGVKKYQGIYANNLTVKGDDSKVSSKALKTTDGVSAGIYVVNKLDIQAGEVVAYGDQASEDSSYGIYAGSQSFDGSHSISGGIIEAQGGTCGEGKESIGLRTKKGNLDISGGTLTLSGNTNGLNASGLITVTNVDNTYISASSENKNAVFSKEPLVLNNATIENATELYVTENTSELVQNGDNPVIIRFKVIVDINGVSMLYPEGKTEYVYGDTVWYTGEPVATINGTTTDVTDQIDEFEYSYFKRVNDEYELNGTPFEAGDYKLVITCYDDDYDGKQEILFTINKRKLTVNYDVLKFEYDEDSHKPGLVFEGLLDGDVASFDSEVASTIYNEEDRIVPSAIDAGKYKIVNNITPDDTFKVLYYEDDMTSNYELETGTISSNFYIFDSIYTTGNIITGSVNESDAYNCEIAPITVDEAKAIVGTNQELLSAIDDGKEVMIYVKLDPISDNNAFDEKNIDNTNAFLFSASLFASVSGSTEVHPINNTNGSKIKISVYLDESQVENIIGSNKNYFVYRKHNGVISELPCRLDKVNNYYMFTFENDLFSDFAIFSKNKPVNPDSSDTNSRVVPNTGDAY